MPLLPTKTAAALMFLIYSPSAVCHEVPGLICSSSSQGLMPSLTNFCEISRTSGLSSLLWHRKTSKISALESCALTRKQFYRKTRPGTIGCEGRGGPGEQRYIRRIYRRLINRLTWAGDYSKTTPRDWSVRTVLSGLQYKILRQGTGEKSKKTVEVNSSTPGEIDSSEKNGSPIVSSEGWPHLRIHQRMRLQFVGSLEREYQAPSEVTSAEPRGLKCSVVWFLQIPPELLSGFLIHLIAVL